MLFFGESFLVDFLLCMRSFGCRVSVVLGAGTFFPFRAAHLRAAILVTFAFVTLDIRLYRALLHVATAFSASYVRVPASLHTYSKLLLVH